MLTMRRYFILAVGLALAGCGGGSSSNPASTHAVRVNVSGLTGSGLVLHNSVGGNAGEDLAISAAGSFAFPTQLPAGATYAVTVKTAPSAPAQVCSVENGVGTMGTADVTVKVSCSSSSNSYAVRATVTGLAGSTGLTLQDNGGDDLVVALDGTFAFTTPIASGGTYAVTVKAQPTPYKSCAVTDGNGTVTNAVVTVTVSCSAVVVQRWEAPTTWGGVWRDDGNMVQHAYFTTTNGSDTQIVEGKGVTWALQNGPLGAPRKLDFPAGSRYGAGPFNGPLYQATAGDGGLAPSGDMLVCAIVKPDYNPESGQEEPIIAKGAGAVTGGGWALVQKSRFFTFEYQSLDSTRTSHSNLAYTPTYFADQGKPGAGPLNPSYLVVCGGRSGDSIYVAANSFASSIWPTGVALAGTGPSTLDAGSHPATIGGYDSGGYSYPGRVYETAVWNEPATPANVQAKFAAVQGLTLNTSEPGAITTYTRNREGPYLGSDGTYHTAWRHGPRIDPTKGFLFGLQGWNHLSYCVTATGAPIDCSATGAKYVAAPGEALDLWTAAGGAIVAAAGAIEPPGDSERPSAKLVTLPPSASLSTPLAPFADGTIDPKTGASARAGPIHAQIWLYVPAKPAGPAILRLTTSNPVAGGTSVSEVDLTTLTPGTWKRFWLTGLTTDSLAGTFTMRAPADNAGNVEFYAWGIDLTQVTGGGSLGSFDPGPAMYDWSTSIGRVGDVPVEQPINPVDMLELPPVPDSTASTGFCLSADARPYEGLSWVSPFVYGQGIASWVDDVNLQVAQLISLGTFKGQVLCFFVTGAPGGACAPAPASWTPGTPHNLKGCLNASDHTLRLYADDVQIATEAGVGSVPDMATGHVVVGNQADTLLSTWRSLGNPYQWNGYVSKVLVCRDQGSGASQASCR